MFPFNNNDILYTILLNVDIDTIRVLKCINKCLNKNCKMEHLWMNRLKRDYSTIISMDRWKINDDTNFSTALFSNNYELDYTDACLAFEGSMLLYEKLHKFNKIYVLGINPRNVNNIPFFKTTSRHSLIQKNTTTDYDVFPKSPPYNYQDQPNISRWIPSLSLESTNSLFQINEPMLMMNYEEFPKSWIRTDAYIMQIKLSSFMQIIAKLMYNSPNITFMDCDGTLILNKNMIINHLKVKGFANCEMITSTWFKK